MNNPSSASSNASQIEYWNTAAGLTWAEFQEQLDRQVGPLGAEAMRVLAVTAGESVLDIGCGCGHTTLDIAARVGPTGHVLGVDISVPMLEVAKRRSVERKVGSGAAEFQQIDAQTDDLGTAAFDAAYSRFGVMFFSDPVAAFINIRRSLKKSGRMAFVCWRPLQESDWIWLPLQAAAPFLPPSPPADPLAPGPFAFADANRVRSILQAAGFGSINIAPHDQLIGIGNVEQTLQLAFRVGPLGAALREHPNCKDVVTQAVRNVLSNKLTPDGVRMKAAVWIVSASAA